MFRMCSVSLAKIGIWHDLTNKNKVTTMEWSPTRTTRVYSRWLNVQHQHLPIQPGHVGCQAVEDMARLPVLLWRIMKKRMSGGQNHLLLEKDMDKMAALLSTPYDLGLPIILSLNVAYSHVQSRPKKMTKQFSPTTHSPCGRSTDSMILDSR